VIRGRTRKILAGVLTVALLGFVAGAIVVGRGHPSAALDLGSGNAWFATIRQGSVALIDGSTGSRVTRVDQVAAPNGHFEVEQSGSSALVIDQDAGTVARIDAATWTRSTPLTVGSPGDQHLAVHTGTSGTGGDTAWVVTQSGTVVQQLNAESMTLIGAPQTLPSEVAGIAVAGDGRLWVSSASGELRSYRDGRRVTTAPLTGLDRTELVLVNQHPVVVDPTTAEARVVDEDNGALGHRVCLDVPTSPTPSVAGATSSEPWLLAVAPTAGTLVVSDVNTDACQAIPLGPTATGGAARYGVPVEKDRRVYVPDFITGQVIVVDPAEPPSRQIAARINLRLPNAEVELLVHHQHVWFNEVRGDQAGVITDDLRALHSPKSDPGAAPGSPSDPTPSDPEAPGQPGGPGETGSGGTSSNPTGPGGPIGPGASVPGSPSTTPDTVPGPQGTPPNGDLANPPAGSLTPQFTIEPSNPVTGQEVVFTDTTVDPAQRHTVVSWSLPGGVPDASTKSKFSATFAVAKNYEITLVITSDAGPQPAILPLTVNTIPTVPDISGMDVATARATLRANQFVLRSRTTSVNSVLPAGLIVDSNPPAGDTALPGTPIDYRDSGPAGVGIISTVASAGFSLPGGLAADPFGNIFVVDQNGSQIKRIAPNGTVSLVASSSANAPLGDRGPAIGANFGGRSITTDARGDVYLLDLDHNLVRKITIASGIITTFAGNGGTDPAMGPGPAMSASLGGASDIFIGADGVLRISDLTSHIYLVTPQGQLSILPPTTVGVPLSNPQAVTVGPDGATYVLMGSQVLRYDGTQYAPYVGTATGSGDSGEGVAALATSMGGPIPPRFDRFGNLYFANSGDGGVRVRRAADGKVYTVAGSFLGASSGDSGLATDAKMGFRPDCCFGGLAFDPQGNMYISDTNNDRIRKVSVVPPS
jgi:sugar lactone lactonase YvrE